MCLRDRHDISIGVAPLLRPPRNLAFLDIIDYGRAVAELLQAIMRVVRSPYPKRPKLVVLEESLISFFYANFYPAWFRKLFQENYIPLEEQ